MDIIGRVLEKLVPLIENEKDLHLNADAQTLAHKLKEIKEFMDDAESRRLGQSSIKNWLEQVQDLAYDVEDALDDWLQQHREEDEATWNSDNLSSKVCLCLQFLCSLFHKVSERRSVALDIKGLNDRVKRVYDEGIEKELKKNILKISAGKCETSSDQWRRTTSCYTSKVLGREMDERNIKKMLLSEKNNDNVEVVCLVAQGGMGKTTLAQKIYKELENEFPVRIWVCVSDQFDKLSIVKDIYEQLERHTPLVSGLESIQNEIKESLRGKSSKRFLLVLDDVWIEDSKEWIPLYDCLNEGGAKGSKILVTTRKHKTIKAMNASESCTYPLGKMTDEQCWSIIREKALSGRDERDCIRFDKDGLEIARKCDGSPLAASFLGSHLQDKTQVNEWKRVLMNKLWNLEGLKDDLFRHFFLSYNELKPEVKRCFSYCAVFPKDHEIDVDDLIKLWMAQGFVSSSNTECDDEGDGMEAKGYECFKDLAQRSFFQDLKKDQLGERVLYCKMHDNVHDFAQCLSTNSRHLWWDHEFQQNFPISDAGKLRSLFCRWGVPTENIIERLKSVRELKLSQCRLEKIPKEIGT